jgi:glucose/arabinose dehydrogenase
MAWGVRKAAVGAVALVVASVPFVALASRAEASTALPSGFFDEKVVDVPGQPTTFVRADDGRIFVAGKKGFVGLVKDGAFQPTPVINISDHVNSAVDRGLLGLALDKDFEQNGFMYLAYVNENHGKPESTGWRTECITRVTVVGDTANPATETPILGKDGCGTRDTCRGLPAGADCLSDEFSSHAMGAIRVGSDGTLWATVGDGSIWDDQDALTRAQGLDYLNGKLLHFTRDGKGIPTNPFWDGNEDSVRSKVYAYGLRNPYRFNLREGSGPVYLGDVGATEFEEVDVATAAGDNFGWPCYEANKKYVPYQDKPECQTLYGKGPGAVKAPLTSYAHEAASAGITGGDFYTGGGPDELRDAYIYADFISLDLYSVQVNADNTAITSGPTPFGTAANTPVDIQTGPDGCLWYLTIPYYSPESAALRRICHTDGNVPPIAKASFVPPNYGPLPLTVQFSSAGSNDPDGDELTYSWNFGDGSTSTEANPTHEFTTKAARTVVLTVRDPDGATATKSLAVFAGDRAPVPVIWSPTSAYKFAVGDTITFAGSASDPDVGNLPASALHWTVQLVHCPGGTTDCHTHSLIDRVGVSGGRWTVEDHGDSYRFRLSLTATDAEGLSTTTTMDIFPRTVTIVLATDPTGLKVVFDESTRVGPYGFEAILGSKHQIQFPSPQSKRKFVSWSDGGARIHTITATNDMTITAETKPK